MLRFLFRRSVVALLVAVTVLTVAFGLTRLSGDLAITIAGPNARRRPGGTSSSSATRVIRKS